MKLNQNIRLISVSDIKMIFLNYGHSDFTVLMTVVSILSVTKQLISHV